MIIFFFKQYADPTDEPIAPFYDQTFEDYELSVEVWKGKNYWGKGSFYLMINKTI